MLVEADWLAVGSRPVDWQVMNPPQACFHRHNQCTEQEPSAQAPQLEISSTSSLAKLQRMDRKDRSIYDISERMSDSGYFSGGV